MQLRRGFLTDTDAQRRSQQLFARLCPHGTIPAESVTQFLVDWGQHPVGLDWVLVVPPDMEPLLPAADRAALVPDDRPLVRVRGGG